MNEVPQDDLARRAALEARLLGQRRAPAEAGIVPIPRDGPLPVSAAQRRMWVQDQLVGNRAINNVSQGYRLRGPLSAEDLGRAFDRVVARHETLRFRFRMDGATLTTGPAARLPRLAQVATPLPEAERDAAARRLYAALQADPFDLATDAPVRAALHEFAQDDFLFACVFHHIACDEWAIRRFLSELSAQYAALRGGGTPEVPQLPVQYADYAAWQSAGLADGRWSEAEAFWKARLAGVPQTLRPPRADAAPAQWERGPALRAGFVLPAPTAAALDRAAGALGATPFMAMLAATVLFLHRGHGAGDLALASPVAARPRPELDGLIGMFTNLVILRSRPAPEARFPDLLAAMREQVIGGLRYQDYPFDAVLRAIGAERAEAPFTDVMFTHRDAFAEPLQVDGIRAEPVGEKTGQAKFGLWVSVLDERDARRVQVFGDGHLYTPESLAAAAQDFQALLREIAGNPDGVAVLPATGPEAPAVATRDGPRPGAADRPVATDTERAVARIWEVVLGRPCPSARQSFFDLGGDSLLLLQLVQRLSQETGTRLAMSAAFADATIAGHARLVEEALGAAHAGGGPGSGSSPAADAPGGDPAIFPLAETGAGATGLPFFIVSGAGGHVLPFAPAARRLGPRWRGLGILDPGFFPDMGDLRSLGDVAGWMLGRAAGAAPDGPLLLVGYSYGAHVAFEMAAQARAGGRSVGLVVLDTRARAVLPESRPKRLYILARSQARQLRNRLAARVGAAGAADDPAGRLYDQPRREERAYRKAIAGRQRVLLMRHRPRPADVPLVVIRARQQIRPGDAADYGWSSLARVVGVHDVDGTHLDLFKGAREAGFAEALDAALETLARACGETG